MVNKNMTDIIDDLKDPLLLHQAEQYIDSVLGRAIITIEKLRKRVAEIERLQYAVGIAVYELNFVAEEHECDQCREVATNIMNIAKGLVKNDENV